MVEIFFFYKKKIAFAAPAFLSKEWAPGWRHPLFPNRATFGSQDLCTSGLCARAPAEHITHRSGRLKAFKVIAMPMSCPELRSWGCSARTHFRVQDQAWGKLCSTYPGATANAPKRDCFSAHFSARLHVMQKRIWRKGMSIFFRNLCFIKYKSHF